MRRLGVFFPLVVFAGCAAAQTPESVTLHFTDGDPCRTEINGTVYEGAGYELRVRDYLSNLERNTPVTLIGKREIPWNCVDGIALSLENLGFTDVSLTPTEIAE